MHLSVITSWTATELSTAIHQRRVSCSEVMRATLRQIDTLNPRFNAIVSRVNEADLLRQADERDAQLQRGESMGWLHGIPQAIKDIAPTAGIASTMGSPLLKNFIPKEDGLMVQRMKAAGCIVIGKTNVPEFGLGSHTFNEVFGATGNAFDPTKSAGGSSGGAAVALATGMLAVADGSDFMGSLRNPAGWNNVFGMRPSQGRVPMWPAQDVWINQLGTEGPMGRCVRDVAKLLAIQSGWDARAPLSIAEDGQQFNASLDADPKGLKIGWLGDLNGYLAMEPGILDVCGDGLKRLESTGCHVEPVNLGMPPERVWDSWLVWRRALVASRLAPFLIQTKNREQMKPEALWEVDQASTLTGSELLSASVTRSQLYQQLLQLFEKVDFLALPTAQVWPFDVTKRWPSAIAGRAMDTYHRWMEVVILPTLAGLPSISVPVGFNDKGLPMGMQLIGKPRGDWALLQLAHAYEQTAQDVLQMQPKL
ncbi:MAG: amidase [Burkholderiaceae bacterium]|nr:amidase [Burkholderiaceae bacterium]